MRAKGNKKLLKTIAVNWRWAAITVGSCSTFPDLKSCSLCFIILFFAFIQTFIVCRPVYYIAFLFRGCGPENFSSEQKSKMLTCDKKLFWESNLMKLMWLPLTLSRPGDKTMSRLPCFDFERRAPGCEFHSPRRGLFGNLKKSFFPNFLHKLFSPVSGHRVLTGTWNKIKSDAWHKASFRFQFLRHLEKIQYAPAR